MSALRDQAARRRLELNPITTSLNVSQQPLSHQTPLSALSANSLSAPFGYHPAAYTPVTPARQYNPQQWVHSPSVASDAGTHFSVARPQDPEGTPYQLFNCYTFACCETPMIVNADRQISSDNCSTSIFSTAKSAYVYDSCGGI